MNVAGPAVSGRYVIVQMDNGEDVPLNLREVMAFGGKGETPSSELHCCFRFHHIYEKKLQHV